ncbi:uncharacterized protein LOC129760104, partial [Uranotaenia lowii]|uniref:uncharacterized protein LOC129760104 n=1 Tax=Uranotaenia lowii TaxID=190385 RepID=UPI00247AC644
MTSPLPLLRSFSTENQNRDWCKRFSLRVNRKTAGTDGKLDFATIRKNKFARRCSSLRQQPTESAAAGLGVAGNGGPQGTQSSQVTLELESAGSPAHSMTIHENSPNKKPKWEVIEHFKSTARGQESISSSLIA